MEKWEEEIYLGLAVFSYFVSGIILISTAMTMW